MLKKIVTWMVCVPMMFFPTSCILDTEYDALPFEGKVMPRITGYNGVSQETNDWMYFNLGTGEIFNRHHAGENIKEGEQYNRTD